MRVLDAVCPLLIVLGLAGTHAALAATPADTAPPSSASLTRQIETIDRDLFDAFNGCELKKLDSFFSPALEFYHDLNGVTWTRERFIGDVQKNVCGKFRRELVPGTMKVFPLGTWGAMYSGTHRFCQSGATRCEGIGRFMHLLENRDGVWRVTRIVSYDHRAAP